MFESVLPHRRFLFVCCGLYDKCPFMSFLFFFTNSGQNMSKRLRKNQTLTTSQPRSLGHLWAAPLVAAARLHSRLGRASGAIRSSLVSLVSLVSRLDVDRLVNPAKRSRSRSRSRDVTSKRVVVDLLWNGMERGPNLAWAHQSISSPDGSLQNPAFSEDTSSPCFIMFHHIPPSFAESKKQLIEYTIHLFHHG